MLKKKNKSIKILILVTAYNVEDFLKIVLKRIPHSIKKYNITILINDDASIDNTYKEALSLKKIKKNIFNIKVAYNKKNLGYGGSQKVGYSYAIKHKFDYVALLHGDAQYAPEKLPKLLNEIVNKNYDAVFGSRMINKQSAIKGGMPLYKFIGNIILTTIQNFLLGMNLSEFHSGYRVYSINSLKKIPFLLNSNSYNFDTEIIIQLKLANMRIKEIPIPPFYGKEVSYLNGTVYAVNVILDSLIGSMHKLGLLYQKKFDVKKIKKKW